MPAGGARNGAGRKKKTDEDLVRNLAEKSIINKHGSLEAGFEALLSSGSDSLVKFVYEHAFGKPKDKIEHSGSLKLGKDLADEFTD